MMPETATSPKALESVKTEALAWADAGLNFTINDPGDYQRVVEYGREAQRRIKAAKDTMKKPKSEAKSVHSFLCSIESAAVTALEHIKKRSSAALQMHDRKEEEARKKREAALAEEERKREEAIRLEEASRLETEGFEEEAQERLETPIVPVQPIIAHSTPKTEGHSSRPKYRCEVINPNELLKAVVEGRADREAMIPDQKYLDAQARAKKDGFKMPGCKLIKERSDTFRG